MRCITQKVREASGVSVKYKKVFRPQDSQHVEKMWIVESEPIPDGWYADMKEALSTAQPRKPGRPKKEQ